MLKLVKNTSNENYPITPQTSAVRKLTVRGVVNTGADLYDSYLVVRNSITTTLNGGAVVRNVGWGQVFGQTEIWQYPATCMIKYATLKVDGMVVEYNEDVNVRAVNMDVYEANHEKRRKYANLGSYGFQRLESGPRAADGNAATDLLSQGAYVSPFLDETVTLDAGAGVYRKTAAAYKEVATVIYLADLFKMCDSLDAKEVYMGGKEVVIELQFENYNQILAEVVNYQTNITANPQIGLPIPGVNTNQTLALNAATLTNSDGTAPTAGVDLTKEFLIATVSTYQHVSMVPLYVGMPICLWPDNLQQVPGTNIAVITGLSVPIAGGVCTIKFKAYTSGNGSVVLPGPPPAVVTPAQFFASLVAGAPAAPIVVALSGINDPVVAPVAAPLVTSTFTNIDAGLTSQYSVNGLELVLVEKPMMTSQKNTINFVQYVRETDVIPTSQLSYNKSFMLDPNTVAVHCMFPPTYSQGSAQKNLLSLSRHMSNFPGNNAPNEVSDGLSYRCLLNGQQLYSRDISFGATDSVEPLYYHRLTLSAMNTGTMLNNLSLNAPFMFMNGGTCHAMISEPVEQSEQPQQLSVRINFTVNSSSRTIYVFKAIRRQISF